MREGKEPLRTFGDLFQFCAQQEEPEAPAKKKRKRRSKKKRPPEETTAVQATETSGEATADGGAQPTPVDTSDVATPPSAGAEHTPADAAGPSGAVAPSDAVPPEESQASGEA